MRTLSVVIPALDEEAYLGATLDHLGRAAGALRADRGVEARVVVVDNDSRDRTAELARSLGAEVVAEPVRNIGRARNAGARASRGEVVLFLDADTLVPDRALVRIAEVLDDPACAGGAIDVDHAPSRASIRLYLRAWRLIGRLGGMAQGAAQFYRRDAFLALGGYDESIYMGEDVDFYWRIGRAAKRAGGHLSYIDDLRVVPSPRRFDRWPAWKTLVWTNPLLITLLRTRKWAWRGWYEDVPR